MPTDYHYGTLYDREGRSRYTGRHIPTQIDFLRRRRWPRLVQFKGVLFEDTGQFEDIFRVYREPPEIWVQD